jgi:predicted MPP superfamily phosphohydrolase
MGIAFLLAAAVFATDLVRLGAWTLRAVAEVIRGPSEFPVDPARRLFFARAAAGAAVATVVGVTAYGTRNALQEPRIREVGVRLERLPRGLDGFTIAQITDLHVGPTIRGKDVKRVVEITNGIKPDLIAITGDLVDGGVDRLRDYTEHLAGLKAKYGIYFVTGNHEYYSGVLDWMEELTRLGIRVLRNERVCIGDKGAGGASFDLAGIDDHQAQRFGNGHRLDLDAALEGRDTDRSLVLLAHQPRTSLVGQAVRGGVELQISGHTHGGQIFPFTLIAGTAFPYLNGLYTHEEEGATGQVYVSPGTGYWGPPMRLGTRAEVAKVVLGSGASRSVT